MNRHERRRQKKNKLNQTVNQDLFEGIRLHTNKDYKQADWGAVQYNEFGDNDYKAASWNKVQMSEFGNDDYKKINWGKVQYKEVLKNGKKRRK